MILISSFRVILSAGYKRMTTPREASQDDEIDCAPLERAPIVVVYIAVAAAMRTIAQVSIFKRFIEQNNNNNKIDNLFLYSPNHAIDLLVHHYSKRTGNAIEPCLHQ